MVLIAFFVQGDADEKQQHIMTIGKQTSNKFTDNRRLMLQFNFMKNLISSYNKFLSCCSSDLYLITVRFIHSQFNESTQSQYPFQFTFPSPSQKKNETNK